MTLSAEDIEKRWDKKSGPEHVLLRPDTYVGQPAPDSTFQWVLDDAAHRMVYRSVTISRAFLKIFDELLVNVTDRLHEHKGVTEMRVDINREKGVITVRNNGDGIPIHVHSKHGKHIAELIFGDMFSGSNFNDEDLERYGGGRNGLGAKLANIFSTEFTVQTVSEGQIYRQEWKKNMSVCSVPKIKPYKQKSFTELTYTPDWPRFGFASSMIDDDHYACMVRRVYDMAGIFGRRGLKVYLNGKLIEENTLSKYAMLYVAEEKQDLVKKAYKEVNNNWEVICLPSDAVDCENVSERAVTFCNGTATIRGGTHHMHVAEQLVEAIQGKINKDKKLRILSERIRKTFFIFVNAFINKPSFDSQLKEFCTVTPSKISPTCALNRYNPDKSPEKAQEEDGYIDKVLKMGILDLAKEIVEERKAKLAATSDGRKSAHVSVKKLVDARHAGSSQSHKCTLILTEGDSAKALAISGLSVIGHEYYGVFPLRGKLPNMMQNEKLHDNEIWQDIKQAIGFRANRTYSTPEELKELRYGHVILMTDQDDDGGHIKGLFITALYKCYPALLKSGFLSEFITPLVKASGPRVPGRVLSFFSMADYRAWKEQEIPHSMKYYKGLGTSTPEEAKEYFRQLKKHRIAIRYDDSTHASLEVAFGTGTENRKAWMLEADLTVMRDYSQPAICITDMVNMEIRVYSIGTLLRSLPHWASGLKHVHIQILHTAFAKKMTSEIKVAQMAGAIASFTDYHHGEESLCSALVNMACTYVTSNNINYMVPSGQFGTRVGGGKDAASPRYIFTMLEPITRLIFHPEDDKVLEFNEDDETPEPKNYCPVIAAALLNFLHGIATGWSCKIIPVNPLALIDYTIADLKGAEKPQLEPWFWGWKGRVETVTAGYKYLFHGVISQTKYNPTTKIYSYQITELPPHIVPSSVAEQLSEHAAAGVIQEFFDNSGENRIDIRFDVHEERRYDVFKTLPIVRSNTNNFSFFDEERRVRQFSTYEEIVAAHKEKRLEMYERRKAYMLKTMKRELVQHMNMCKFVRAVREKKIDLAELDGDAVESKLEQMGFSRLEGKFDYLLDQQCRRLLRTDFEAMTRKLAQMDEKVRAYEARDIKSLWLEDLENLRREYVKWIGQRVLEVAEPQGTVLNWNELLEEAKRTHVTALAPGTKRAREPANSAAPPAKKARTAKKPKTLA